MTWSLCMIVKNEEEVLGRCLDSVGSLFDEIIIVDTGSTDKTKEIAEKYTKKIYSFPWIDDFSAARNFSFSKATKEYVMWLDADDIITEEDYKKLKKLKTKETGPDIIMLKYNIGFDAFGNVTFSYYRERLLKREKNYTWNDKVHEYIALSGTIEKEDIAITHKKMKVEKSDRNLKIYEKMEKDGEVFSPRNYYYYGRELHDHQQFEKSNFILETFLNTGKGWIEDNIGACILISDNYKSLNREQRMLDNLTRTFAYDLPRSKPCYLLAEVFFTKKDYEKAIYWYTLAYQKGDISSDGFVEGDYSTFLPCLQLCVSYGKIGDHQKSYYYHLESKKYKPKHPSVIYNEEYFSKFDFYELSGK